ncbi:MAG: hypothetical protein IJV01_04435 [Bacteroidales bacterium]|nr:hypothetical protein [Bacteroidales bacterium]
MNRISVLRYFALCVTVGVLFSCESEEETVITSKEEAVDLGLSVKWGEWNLGASKPDEYGDYYAWGEIEPKTDYSWPSYKWCNGSLSSLTKYNTSTEFGFVDNRELFEDYDYKDDAARRVLGGTWRVPTDAEWTELRDKCTWKWTSDYKGTGVAGMVVTSNVDGYKKKSIFFPAAGCRVNARPREVGSSGAYWSASLANSPASAFFVSFYSDVMGRNDYLRCFGLSIRPVSD